MKTKDLVYLTVTLIVIFVGMYFWVTKKPVAEPVTSVGSSKVHYTCETGYIDAIYKDTSVTLTLSGSRILDLPQTLSGSGLRYEQDTSVFISKGDNAFFEENGEIIYKDCVAGNTSSTSTKEKMYFTDQGKTFSFSYPRQMTVSGGGIGYTKEWSRSSDLMGSLFVKAKIPKDIETNTNFSEAVFTVGASSDPKARQNCLTATGGEQMGVGAKSIGGVPYAKFTLSDAGAGNFYDTTSYRTIYNDQCYAIEYTIHSTNIGNYDPSQGIKEFDKQKINSLLESVVQSFTFLKNNSEADNIIKSLIGGAEVKALEVVEDSRCPVEAVCVWAGRVRVKVRVTKGLNSAEDVVTLLEPKTIAGVTVTLTSVSPEKTEGVLNFSDYKFTFSTK